MRYENRAFPGPALYSRILPGCWRSLPEPIRRAHGEEGDVFAEGRFRVTGFGGNIHRILARIARLPVPAEEVEVRLWIEQEEGGERWIRTFGEKRFITWQESSRPGEILETAGPWRFRFRLTGDWRGIQYRQLSCALRIARAHIPLPGWLSPRVEASEFADESAAAVRVTVTISAPLLGKLTRYEGMLNPGKSEPCK